MSKATKTRRPGGIQHSNLATPAECVGVQAPNETPSAICHVALRCRRCGLCAYHCSCAAELEPPTVTQSPDAPLSMSGTQRKQPEPVQMRIPMKCYLCRQSIERPDVYVVPGPDRWSEPDDPTTWPLEPTHQDCLSRAVKLMGQQ
jgi:ferredoxin